MGERRMHLREGGASGVHVATGAAEYLCEGASGIRFSKPSRDECFAEYATRGVMVVRFAEQAKIVEGSWTAQGERVAVFEGQEAALPAPATRRVDEGALAAVALPDLSHDGTRDVARIRPRRCVPLCGRRHHGSTTPAGTGPSPFQLVLDELVESTFEKRCQVTARKSMARQLAGLLDLRAEGGTGSEFDAIALRGQGLYSRTRRRRSGCLAQATGRRRATRGRGACPGTGHPRARAGRDVACSSAQRQRRRPERFDPRRYVRTRKADGKDLLELTPRPASRIREQCVCVLAVEIPVQEEQSC